MKKKILFALLTLMSIFILYAAFSGHIFHKEIKINAAVSVIHREISSYDRIARWFMPFASADTGTNGIIKKDRLEYDNTILKITNITGFSTTCQVVENNKTETLLYTVIPDTGHYSKVTLAYKTTLWNEFFKTGKTIQNAIKGLEDLKDYLGDAKKMYGYDVEMTSVTDTAFLFSSKIVPVQNKKTAIKNLYESLIRFAKEKDLGFNGVRIFYILNYGKDSLHLFTSIGITNPESAPMSGPYILKRMPYMGRLLMSYYQGSFGKADAALNALEQFKIDNGMNSMAIPFIKLITEGIEFDDSQIIQARALYPVY
jgi:hypothetical protein